METVTIGTSYDNAHPYREGTDFYITAGWSDYDAVPPSLVVGDGSTTRATYNREEVTFVNEKLSRKTSYQIYIVVHLDSGVPGVS